MVPAITRGGQRLSSISWEPMSCLIRRIWSSVSKIVKFDLSPAASAFLRKIRAPMAWKVPTHIPSIGRLIKSATRSFISLAALFVKVTASISQDLDFPCIIICPIRVVRTRVFPVPAPAKTNSGPSTVLTAWSCVSFRLSKYGMGMGLGSVEGDTMRGSNSGSDGDDKSNGSGIAVI